jgi:hypothetical protein
MVFPLPESAAVGEVSPFIIPSPARRSSKPGRPGFALSSTQTLGTMALNEPRPFLPCETTIPDISHPRSALTALP